MMHNISMEKEILDGEIKETKENTFNIQIIENRELMKEELRKELHIKDIKLIEKDV